MTWEEVRADFNLLKGRLVERGDGYKRQDESGMRNVFKSRDSNTNGIRLCYKVVSSLTLRSMASEWHRRSVRICSSI